jgi:hypothetical protein
VNERKVVLRLLKDTAVAHGEFEKTELGGVYDEQWPEWYATYFVDRLHGEGLRIG